MKKVKNSKTIRVDIFLYVCTEQYFEVPLDFEIKGSTPEEAYQSLAQKFEDQNPNAFYRPEYVDISGEVGVDFRGIREEFYIHNNATKEDSIISFDNE
jgi:hypothetical protein